MIAGLCSGAEIAIGVVPPFHGFDVLIEGEPGEVIRSLGIAAKGRGADIPFDLVGDMVIRPEVKPIECFKRERFQMRGDKWNGGDGEELVVGIAENKIIPAPKAGNGEARQVGAKVVTAGDSDRFRLFLKKDEVGILMPTLDHGLKG